MVKKPPVVFACNGASVPRRLIRKSKDVHILEYREDLPGQNIKLSLPDFVRGVYHLPDRILDLLELAAYVFSADRLRLRGHKDDLEYQSWPRSLHFVIGVRDFDFWSRTTVREKLIEALRFMSGDDEYEFTFQKGHSTLRTSLFDSEEFKVDPSAETRIVLFSGGLDSLTGVLDSLETLSSRLCLVSHQSQPGTIRTQDQLSAALTRMCHGRIAHYKFHCTLKGIRASEETQRTRAFLYSAIAYSLATAFSESRFSVYENGITAINFPRRQDLMNARASRTTHPKTIALLQDFYSELHEKPFEIETPYLWKTKTDVTCRIAELGKQDLITSSVSCSRTFRNLGQATHCGGCSQCIDRRFAVYAAELDDIDNVGIYALDFISQKIVDGEVKTTLVDYVRQAANFAQWNIDHFYKEMINELVAVTERLPLASEVEGTEKVWDLCRRHGTQVEKAINRMRSAHEKVYDFAVDGSFLQLVSQREYLQEPIQRLARDISKRLSNALPLAFQKNPPRDEPDFNDKVSAILNSEREKFEREHPSISFALAHTIPDHSTEKCGLLIESKYIRGATSPSKVTDGMAADLTKYPSESHILFIVYDPNRAIKDDEAFRTDFEGKGRCTVEIIR